MIEDTHPTKKCVFFFAKSMPTPVFFCFFSFSSKLDWSLSNLGKDSSSSVSVLEQGSDQLFHFTCGEFMS